MELGGKNSAIVLPDADLEKAAKSCIAGSFLHVCLTPLDFRNERFHSPNEPDKKILTRLALY